MRPLQCSMPRLLLLAILPLSISGCAPVVSSAPCLPVTSWSPAQQSRVADELQALPPEDPLRLFIGDYGAMRESARACLRASK